MRASLRWRRSGYAYNAWLMLTGKGVPYKDTFDNKPPGVFFMYALFISVFGESPAAVHIGTYVYSILTLIGVYLLAGRLFGRSLGLVAGLAFVIYSTAQSFFGFSSNTEIFMIMPMVFATFLALVACEKKAKRLFLAVGFLCGWAFMFKQVAATNILFIALYMLYRHLKSAERKPLSLVASYALLFVSFSVPILLFGLYFHLKGGLWDAFYQMFLFNLEYRGFRPPASYFFYGALSPVLAVVPAEGGPVNFNSFAAYWVFVLWAFVRMLLKKDRALVFVFLFFIFSYAGSIINFFFFPHYFIQIVPAVSILAGWGMADIFLFLKEKNLLAGAVAKGALLALMGLCLVLPLLLELDYYVLNSADANVRRIYAGNPFSEALVVADYVRKNTRPEDTVLILGSEPEVLYYAKRKSATRHNHLYAVVGNYKNAFDRQNEVKEDVKKNRPSCAIYFTTGLTWHADPEKSEGFFEWMRSYLRDEFELDGVIVRVGEQGATGFEMIEGAPARRLHPKILEKAYVLMYKRKK